MSKSLAELRASAHTSLPERAYSLCLAQGLVAEAQSLQQERGDLDLERATLTVGRTDENGEASGPPKRVGEGDPPRVAEIDARLAEIDERLEVLADEMRDHTGELRLRAIPAGEWRRWVDTNPAREDSKIDEDAAYGLCDSSALLGSLRRFATSYNGDDLGEGDWDFIANRAAPGDLKAICREVVQMHELAGALPKGSRKGSSATPPSVSDSSSPERSGSAPSDS